MDFKYFKDLIKKDKNKAIAELKNIKDVDLVISLIKVFGTFVFDGLSKNLKENEKILDFLLKNNFDFFLNIYKNMNNELQSKYVFKNVEKLYLHTKNKSKELKEFVILEKKLIHLLNEDELLENFRIVSYIITRDLKLLQYSKPHQEDNIFIFFLLIYYPASQILQYCNNNCFLHKIYRYLNKNDELCKKVLIEQDIDTIMKCVIDKRELLEQSIILEQLLKKKDNFFKLVEQVPTLDFVGKLGGQLEAVKDWKDFSLVKFDEIPTLPELDNHRLTAYIENMGDKITYEFLTEFLLSFLSISFKRKITLSNFLFMSVFLKLPVYGKKSFRLEDFYDVFTRELNSNNPFPMTKTLKTTYSSFMAFCKKKKFKSKNYKEYFFEFIVFEKNIGDGLGYEKLEQALQLICKNTNFITYDSFLEEYTFNEQIIYDGFETDLYLEILKVMDLISKKINLSKDFDINEVMERLKEPEEDDETKGTIKRVILEIIICKEHRLKDIEKLLSHYNYDFITKMYEYFYVTIDGLTQTFSE